MVYNKICEVCGTPFVAEMPFARYCSRTCRQNNWAKKNPEKIREIRKRWFEANKERLREYYLKHKEQHREAQRRYRQKHPEDAIKKHARHVSERLPIGPYCEECGSTEDLQKHHKDYSKPLEFITLCRLCHAKKHRLIKEENN